VPCFFDVSHVVDVPEPEQHAVLLSAREDLDLATVTAARAELLAACAAPGAALLLDVTGVFVGVVLVRCLAELVERSGRAGKAVVVIGAPGWLVDLRRRLSVPPVLFADTVDAAVAALRPGQPVSAGRGPGGSATGTASRTEPARAKVKSTG
jgi:hypothetical protein